MDINKLKMSYKKALFNLRYIEKELNKLPSPPVATLRKVEVTLWHLDKVNLEGLNGG